MPNEKKIMHVPSEIEVYDELYCCSYEDETIHSCPLLVKIKKQNRTPPGRHPKQRHSVLHLVSLRCHIHRKEHSVLGGQADW